ncbi:MAG: flavin reductase family protein [Candidatus Woesearchaeota archaeon]
MKSVNYENYIDEVLDIITDNGIFLTTQGEKLNTMTIGWANFGVVWGEPILMILVRKSRYTYKILESSDEFTVSIPQKGKMKKELMFCGSKSGKKYDKFKECDLNKLPGQNIKTPVIGECMLHFECKIKYKQDMQGDNLVLEYKNKWYKNDDFHRLYFGNIVNCYLT